MFLLQCPKCKNKMKYESRGVFPKQKQCVFCGRSFASKNAVVKSFSIGQK